MEAALTASVLKESNNSRGSSSNALRKVLRTNGNGFTWAYFWLLKDEVPVKKEVSAEDMKNQLQNRLKQAFKNK